jgi:hypothetical protein
MFLDTMTYSTWTAGFIGTGEKFFRRRRIGAAGADFFLFMWALSSLVRKNERRGDLVRLLASRVNFGVRLHKIYYRARLEGDELVKDGLPVRFCFYPARLMAGMPAFAILRDSRTDNRPYISRNDLAVGVFSYGRNALPPDYQRRHRDPAEPFSADGSLK